MSSVFSRKITMSTFSGCFTGDGTPWNQRTGPQAHVEVEDLAQGDVEAADATADRRGQRALDADEVLAEGVDGGSSGSQSPVSLNAFSPASTSRHSIVLPCLAAAASSTSLAAGQMSTPVPSPSMKGMIGLVGNVQGAVCSRRDLLGHGGRAYRHRGQASRREAEVGS